MILTRVFAGLVLTVAGFGQTGIPGGTGIAISTTPITYNYAPIGLASSETIQVNLANLASNVATVVVGQSSQCTGSVSFLSAAGAQIGSATPFIVNSGQTISVGLPFAGAGIVGNRGVIRAVVVLSPASSYNYAFCNLSSSIETFDTISGVTHLFLTNSGFAGVYAILGGLSPVAHGKD